jgi:hypothetical protein
LLLADRSLAERFQVRLNGGRAGPAIPEQGRSNQAHRDDSCRPRAVRVPWEIKVLVGTAIAQMLSPFIALVCWKTSVAPGAAVPVIGLNGVFIVLFAISALRCGRMKCR